MVDIVFDKSIGKIVIETDDPFLHNYFEKREEKYQYIPWQKKWGYVNNLVKIYDNKRTEIAGGRFRFILGRGWACYLLGILKDKITQEQYDNIVNNVVLADSYPNREVFTNLRDYQKDDINFILHYRVGLVSTNTSYGKTECISTLVNYFHEVLGKKVLIVTPSNKARDEIVKRCKVRYNLDVSNNDKKINGHLDSIITSGVMNSKKSKSDEFKKKLSEYEIVLVDEVEYTVESDGGKFIYDNCIGAERCYAFSGTSDKIAGECITFANGLSDIVIRNRNLVKYFGPSLVYRLPLNRDINNIVIRTFALDSLSMPNLSDSKNLYFDIMKAIWTDKNICNVIMKIIERYPMLFIPINSLSAVIENWISNYFKGRYRVLLICSSGYIYYDLDGSEKSLTLDEVCDYAKNDLIDVIPSTSSGYRALDIPKLNNILLIQGNIAGVVLQSIGRIARVERMNVISLSPKGNRKIPVYTKSAQERDKMMKEYYKHCDITDIMIEEEDLY